MKSPILGTLLLCAASTPLAAQSAPSPQLGPALREWQARHGPGWSAVVDPETGFARFVHGGSAAPAFRPRADAEFLALALSAARESRPLHGIDASTLAGGEVLFLPLGLASSSDKVTVQFRQEVSGVPVVRAFLSVLFDARGRLLSVDTTGLPGLHGFATVPALSPAEAAAAAGRFFAADERLPAQEILEPELVVDQALRAGRRVPVLAWQVQVSWNGDPTAPVGFLYRVDAADGSLVSRERSVHYVDVSGNVKSMVSPGTLPDKANNPEAPEPPPHLIVVSPTGNATTDANGDFTLVGATPPVNVTLLYEGTFVDVNNTAGPDHATDALLTQPSGNQLVMNTLMDEYTTAQANAYKWVTALRDWTRSVNPLDATADFQAVANCNLPAPCNAFYNGISVNFFLDSVLCVNSAYSTVVVHEMGHWLNQRYGSGNGNDGFGEGNADVFAMYVVDDPIVGKNFCGTGCHIRTGLNGRQFCGDCCGGCYGEVHDDGEVLMGALWKVRANLKSSLGGAAGQAAANTLFNSWMNAYNDGQIKSIIETHWLVLDDDDGNLSNGTPNFQAIDTGFRAQGFPGVNVNCATTSIYCVSKTSSTGTNPQIGYSGEPKLSTNDLVVTVADAVPQKNGLFFWGDLPNNQPFMGGFLCVKPPLTRGPVLTTDVFGFAGMAVPITPAMVGTTLDYQFWFRDPAHPDGTGIGLSNAVEFGFCAN